MKHRTLLMVGVVSFILSAPSFADVSSMKKSAGEALASNQVVAQVEKGARVVRRGVAVAPRAVVRRPVARAAVVTKPVVVAPAVTPVVVAPVVKPRAVVVTPRVATPRVRVVR